MVDMNKIVGRWHPIKGPINVFVGMNLIKYGTEKDEGTFILVENELYEEDEIWFVSQNEFIVVIKNDNNLAILREAGLQELK